MDSFRTLEWTMGMIFLLIFTVSPVKSKWADLTSHQSE
jgi:hypothetical protein